MVRIGNLSEVIKLESRVAVWRVKNVNAYLCLKINMRLHLYQAYAQFKEN